MDKGPYDFIAKEYRSIQREFWCCGGRVSLLIVRWLGLCVVLICALPLILVAPPALYVFIQMRERLTDDLDRLSWRLDHVRDRQRALNKLVYLVNTNENALRTLASVLDQRRQHDGE